MSKKSSRNNTGNNSNNNTNNVVSKYEHFYIGLQGEQPFYSISVDCSKSTSAPCSIPKPTTATHRRQRYDHLIALSLFICTT